MLRALPTEQAQQNNEVGFGITSFGVTDKKIWMFFYQGPICNENLFNQGPEQKTENVIREIRLHLIR